MNDAGRSLARRDLRRARCVAGAAVAALWVTLACASASADAPLAEAIDRYEHAMFEDALRALDRAETSSRLTRQELVDLLALRALSHYALGDRDAVDADLRALVSLDRDYDFGARMPPAMRPAFDRIVSGAEPVEIVAEATRERADVRVRARVRADPAGLVRRVRVGARQANGPWRMSLDAPLVLEGAADASTVELYAVALGPGDAEIATDGSRAAPRRLVLTHAASAGAGSGAGSAETSDGAGPWWWLAGGAVAVAAAAVLLYFVLAPEDDPRTEIGTPFVER